MSSQEAAEATVIRFPTNEKLTFHLPFPNLNAILQAAVDTATGMSDVASAMQEVVERFDALSEVFSECREATYETDTHIIRGQLVFVFHVPRRYLSYMTGLGFSPVEDDGDSWVQ